MEVKEPVIGDFGFFWAICCTSEVLIKDVNRLLESLYNQNDGPYGRVMPNPEPACWVVISDDPDKVYDKADIVLDDGSEDENGGIWKSPCIGKQPHEIVQLLLEVRKKTGGNIDLGIAVLLDDQGVRDHTVRIISLKDVPSDDSEPNTSWMILADWDSAATVPMCTMSKGMFLEEYVGGYTRPTSEAIMGRGPW